MIAGAWICLLAPLGGALAITLTGPWISRRVAGLISTLTTFLAFAGALIAFFGLWSRDADDREHLSTAYTWLAAGDFQVGFEILVDPLSVMMMLVVSGVGGLIVWYSIGYMAGDDEERRFFAYMSLFVFSMLLLVQAGNFLLLLVGWGLVGLASYLLIGFWHRRPEAVAAAKKAFVMNAIGDATFALAIVLLIWSTGTLEFFGVFEEVDGLSKTTVNLVALGLLGGAVAKSAQIPLHTWLAGRDGGPDPRLGADPRRDDGDRRCLPARAGAPDLRGGARHPEPRGDPRRRDVARRGSRRPRAVGHQASHRLFDHVPDRLHVPRCGDRSLRLRDLPPDDACLLQGAALPRGRRRHPSPYDEQDIRRMGGLKTALPRTHIAFLIGTVALVGLPPFAGFWSKDAIIASALARGDALGWTLFIACLLGVLLTGAYSFRLYFAVFQGDAAGGDRPRRPTRTTGTGRGRCRCSFRSASSRCSQRSAGCSRFPASGTRSRTGWRRRASRSSRRPPAEDYLVSAISVALGIVGLLLARRAFLADRQLVTAPTAWRVFEHKLYFDELYDALFYRPAAALSNALRRRVEEPVIERSLDEIGSGTILASDGLARVQSGLLRTYALAIAFSVCVLVIVFVAVR